MFHLLIWLFDCSWTCCSKPSELQQKVEKQKSIYSYIKFYLYTWCHLSGLLCVGFNQFQMQLPLHSMAFPNSNQLKYNQSTPVTTGAPSTIIFWHPRLLLQQVICFLPWSQAPFSNESLVKWSWVDMWKWQRKK